MTITHMAYIIKNNLPGTDHTPEVCRNESSARSRFMLLAGVLADKYDTKVSFRNKPLRGTIKVEIDGFYYYVELFRK